MTNLAETACRRCREQKLRCSREPPECARCSKFGVVCSYPAPPNRKVLAALRAQPKTRCSTSVHPKLPTGARRSNPRSPTPGNLSSRGTRVVHGDSGAASIYLQLPQEIHELLQEVYFSCQFHSTLLFHPTIFAQDFGARIVPQHVLLAMYANATIFLRQRSSLLARHAELLRSLGDLKELGRQWAQQAGRTVLTEIDQPVFESVQTCEMLFMYWFSVGEYKRNAMFLSIAYQAACILGLDSKDGHACLKGSKSTASTAPEWLRAEIARRCFWAVWFTRCIDSDHSLTGISINDRVMNLLLPMDEMSYGRSQRAASATLSAILEKPSSTSTTECVVRDSIFGELLVLVLYWAKIRQLIESRTQLPARDWLPNVYELEGQLTRWRADLAIQFTYSKRNLYEQPIVAQQSLLIYVHALYHQCRTVLHSCLVPHFSGLHLPDTVPAEVTNVSARIALRSAQEISNLGADLLALDWDPCRIPGFVGYCMYVSASIQIGILGSTDLALKACARTSLITTLGWLKSMAVFWSNSENLWARIHILYAAQMSRMQAWSTETDGSISSGCPEKGPKDLDQLAGEVRDPGQLPEPLADSVLEYSVCRLRPVSKVYLRKIQDLEDSTSPDLMSQLMAESLESDQYSASWFLDPDRDLAIPTGLNQFPSRESLAAAASSKSLDWMNTPQTSVPQSTPWDWWGFNLDPLQQQDFRYNNLLGFSNNIDYLDNVSL